jgi:hypothetical protein
LCVECQCCQTREKTKKTPTVKSAKKQAATAAQECAAVERAVEGNCEKYKVDHLSVFTQAGLAWPPVFSAEFEEKTASLLRREAEILYLDEHITGTKDVLTTWYAKDLQMTVEWGREVREQFSCIVSTSTFWLRGLVPPWRGQPARRIDRRISGAELLSLQGFSLEDQNDDDGFTNQNKTDLAGNAFSGAVLLAVATSIFATVPISEALKISDTILALKAGESFVETANEGKVEADHSDNSGDSGEEGSESGSAISESDGDGHVDDCDL